jgi:hypothetical protein
VHLRDPAGPTRTVDDTERGQPNGQSIPAVRMIVER